MAVAMASVDVMGNDSSIAIAGASEASISYKRIFQYYISNVF